MMNAFKPVTYADGYLPIEDHGLIGDGATAALVGRDGAISWMCAPRFDSPPVFCRILDARRGGYFTLAPEGLIESRQYYEPDTAVLVTEMRGPAGLVRVTDALTLRQGADLTEDAAAGRCELLRVAEVVGGNARLRIEIEPRGESRIIARSGGLFIRNPACPVCPARRIERRDGTRRGLSFESDIALGRRRQQTQTAVGGRFARRDA